MREVLVLDDMRSFTDTDERRFTHVRCTADAIAAMENGEYDEVYLDYDLRSTDPQALTGEQFAHWLVAHGTRGAIVRIITDMPHGAQRLARILGDECRHEITALGLRWNEERFGSNGFGGSEEEFLAECGWTSSQALQR